MEENSKGKLNTGVISNGFFLCCFSTVEIQEESMSGVQFFFTVLFSILGLGVLAVVGLVVYGRWKENRRKRFY